MMRVFQKNVTDHEVNTTMETHREWIWCDVVPRKVTDPDPPPEPIQGKMHQRGTAQEAPKKSQEVTVEEHELLEDIFENPHLSITGRGSRLGLSANKMNSLKQSAIGKGLVEQFSINLGKKYGGRVTLLALTENGYNALGKKSATRPNNVSPEHWWWQVFIRDYFTGKGFRAEIEKNLNGKCADVGLLKNDVWVAIEIELSPKNAVSNIVEDISAGFGKVVCCCKDKRTLSEVSRRLNTYAGYESIKDRVELRVLSELTAIKETFG